MKDIVLAVTYRCNSRCRMCNIWQTKDFSGELTLEDFNKLPVDLRYLNLSGGEPFLRMDLPEIIATVKKRCPKVSLTISTNGFATEIILEKMKKILTIDPEINVAVSLDGVGKVHEEVRNIPDAFNKVMNTLHGLKAMGAKNLRLAYTIGDYNFAELKKIYELSKQEGVEMTIAAVHSSDIFFNINNEMKATKEIAAELSWLSRQELRGWNPKHWLRAYFAYGLAKFVSTGKRVLPNYSGILDCFVDPWGDVYPCDIANEKIGNLKEGFVLVDIEKRKSPDSWMICTAREAMRRHWFRVGMWILKEKIMNHRA